MSNATEKAQELHTKFKKWRNDLRPFWEQIRKNRELYEFHKSEGSIADSDISLNTSFAIIESLTAKQNEATLIPTIKARGQNGYKQIEQFVSDVIKGAIEDPTVSEMYGSFRKFRETSFRSLLIEGNVAAEQKYAYKKDEVDNPYACQLPLFSVIFNPTKTLATSDEYFVEKYVTYQELKNNEYQRDTKRGLYKNLSKLRNTIKNDYKDMPDLEDRLIAGDTTLPRKVSDIHLLEHWKGDKLTVVANGSVIVREATDPFKTGTHPLVFAMLYTVEGRPYAYGKMDAIYKVVRAQDTIVNQAIDSVARFLRPSVLIKDPQMDLMSIATIMESGGVAYGDAAMVEEVRRTLPPPAAYQSTEQLQQAVERAALYSPYASGTAAQTTDKTKGTASGIQSIQAAAEPNFQIILDTFQDMFIAPLLRKFLRSIANLMDEKDIRWVLTSGENSQWIKATKNLLLGKPTLQDLAEIGILTEQDLFELTHTLQTRQDGIVEPVPIDGVDTTPVFDTDWVLSVSMTNNASSEKQQRLNNIASWAQFAMQSGVPVDMQKIALTLGNRIDDFDADEYILQQNQMQQPGMGMPQQPLMPEMSMGQPQAEPMQQAPVY